MFGNLNVASFCDYGCICSIYMCIMTFSHSIEYNMRNIFLENHSENVLMKLVLDPFIKNKKRIYP